MKTNKFNSVPIEIDAIEESINEESIVDSTSFGNESKLPLPDKKPAPQKKQVKDSIIESSIIDDVSNSGGQNDQYFKKVKRNLKDAAESSSIVTEIVGMSRSENPISKFGFGNQDDEISEDSNIVSY